MMYRSDVWLRIIGNFVFILIQTSIWKAILGDRVVEGVQLNEMITYSILNTVISILLMDNILRVIDTKLKTGNIVSDLTKPIKLTVVLFFQELGNVIFRIVFVLIPTITIALLLYDISLPNNSITIFYTLLSLFFTLMISFLIGYIISLIAFWFLTTFALEWMIGALIVTFSGSFLPLWFFPENWRVVAEILPFQFLNFVPSAIYLEKITGTGIIKVLAGGMIWMLLLGGLAKFLWYKATRRLIVQGG